MFDGLCGANLTAGVAGKITESPGVVHSGHEHPFFTVSRDVRLNHMAGAMTHAHMAGDTGSGKEFQAHRTGRGHHMLSLDRDGVFYKNQGQK